MNDECCYATKENTDTHQRVGKNGFPDQAAAQKHVAPLDARRQDLPAAREGRQELVCFAARRIPGGLSESQTYREPARVTGEFGHEPGWVLLLQEPEYPHPLDVDHILWCAPWRNHIRPAANDNS